MYYALMRDAYHLNTTLVQCMPNNTHVLTISHVLRKTLIIQNTAFSLIRKRAVSNTNRRWDEDFADDITHDTGYKILQDLYSFTISTEHSSQTKDVAYIIFG